MGGWANAQPLSARAETHRNSNITNGNAVHNMKLFASSQPSGRVEKERPALNILLSFFLPMVVITAALAGLKIVPFGDHSLVISDGNALYVNYLGYVGRAVRGLEGFTYSFEKGLGGNMMGSWGWFLLNPTFVLFALFDIADYHLAYTLVSTLNLCLCGLTMYLLLAGVNGHRLSNLIFSTSYALCGFNVANVFQMNFFVGVTVLPLVVLGLIRIFQDRGPLLYILSLGYALLMNFYFGFMLCAASVLFFCAAWIADGNSVRNKKRVFLKYCLSSLLAGLLSAVIWLPALLSLRGGRLDQTTIASFSLGERLPFLEIGAKLFSGANSTAELSNGRPNVFVGILPVALVILFFRNREIDRRKKTAAAFLLAVYAICFYIIAFDLLMHGGTTTNWFNFRYSFVFSFLLLFIAAYEWRYFTAAPAADRKFTWAAILLGVVVVFSKRYEFISGGEVLADLAILAVVFLALWMHRKDPAKNTARIFALVMLLLMSFNLFLNYRVSTKRILAWEYKESEYQDVVNNVDALVKGVQQGDPGFHRMEINRQRSATAGNDPMLYGYDGVGHGGSDERNFVRNQLSKLGVHRFDMRNYYGEGVPAATDTLLGIRYIIAEENLAEEKGYEKVVTLGGWTLYRNPDALPLAFLSDPGIEATETDYTDIFANLNTVWSALSGEDTRVFEEENEITFLAHPRKGAGEITRTEAAAIVEKRDQIAAAEGEQEPSSATSREEPPTDISYIKYTWTASRDGAVYVYNRSGVIDDRGAIEPQMNCVGYYHVGDTVTGYLPVADDSISTYLLEDVAGRFRAAYADTDALAALSEKVRFRPTTIEKLSESHLRGEFTSDGNQILLFTIPWDEGWTLWVDGEKAEIRKVLDLFMTAEAPAGIHSYELRFVPTGLKAGAAAAAVGAVLLILFLLFDLKNRRERPPRKEEGYSSQEPGSTDAPGGTSEKEAAEKTPSSETGALTQTEAEERQASSSGPPENGSRETPAAIDEEALRSEQTEEHDALSPVSGRETQGTGTVILLVKVLVCPIVAGIVGVLMLILSFLLPVHTIRKNVQASLPVLLTEGLRYSFTPSDTGSYLDNYTDAIYLNEAMVRPELADLPACALSGVVVVTEGAQNWIDYLRKSFESEKVILAAYEQRFFNGYLVLVKLLLELTDYSGIRSFNGVAMGLLFFALCALMLKKGLGAYILPITVSMALMRPLALSLSMAYAGFYYCMLVPCLIMLAANEKLNRAGCYALFFECVGCCTFFFNMNYIQMLTFVFPFLFYLLLNGIPGKAINVLKTGAGLFAAWAFGYYGMMLVKWIAYALVLHRPGIFTEMWDLIRFRTSSTGELSEPIARSWALRDNVLTAVSNIWLDLAELGFLAYQVISMKRAKDYRAFTQGELILFLVMLLFPLGRYLVFSNHSYIHAFVMYRLFIIPILALNILLVYISNTAHGTCVMRTRADL